MSIRLACVADEIRTVDLPNTAWIILFVLIVAFPHTTGSHLPRCFFFSFFASLPPFYSCFSSSYPSTRLPCFFKLWIFNAMKNAMVRFNITLPSLTCWKRRHPRKSLVILYGIRCRESNLEAFEYTARRPVARPWRPGNVSCGLKWKLATPSILRLLTHESCRLLHLRKARSRNLPILKYLILKSHVIEVFWRLLWSFSDVFIFVVPILIKSFNILVSMGINTTFKVHLRTITEQNRRLKCVAPITTIQEPNSLLM